MAHVEVSAGTIEYDDTGGNGPVVVFVPGLLMDGAQWRQVVANLRDEFRCVLPTLPMGAHQWPMRPEALPARASRAPCRHCSQNARCARSYAPVNCMALDSRAADVLRPYDEARRSR